MVKINPKKIPVRIVQAHDVYGNKQVGVTLDISYYVDGGEDASKQVEKFRRLYFTTLNKAKKLLGNKKRKTSKQYWHLSKLLQDFNAETENEFFITNYRTALERDFGITDSYVGVIFDFGKFFNEEEIIDEIPFSVYFELALKKRKLDKLGLFAKEKEALLKKVKTEKIPIHKDYRNYLKNLLS